MPEYETVVLDRVFDLQRPGASGLRFHTQFSFESAARTRLGVRIFGRPIVAQGMRITAALAKEGDWSTLLGWKDWTNDTIVTQGGTSLALYALILLSFFVLPPAINWFGASQSIPAGPGWLALFAAPIAAVLFVGYLRSLRTRKLLLALTRPSEPSASTTNAA